MCIRDSTSFDTSFNFGFDFGPSEEMSTIAPENAVDTDAAHAINSADFNPFAPIVLKNDVPRRPRATANPAEDPADAAAERIMADERAPFRKPCLLYTSRCV